MAIRNCIHVTCQRTSRPVLTPFRWGSCRCPLEDELAYHPIYPCRMRSHTRGYPPHGQRWTLPKRTISNLRLNYVCSRSWNGRDRRLRRFQPMEAARWRMEVQVRGESLTSPCVSTAESYTTGLLVHLQQQITRYSRSVAMCLAFNF